MRPLLLLLALLSAVHAVSFDLQAVHENGYTVKEFTKCFTMYFGKDVLIEGKVNTPVVQGQRLMATARF
jgi:hypothetical protein